MDTLFVKDIKEFEVLPTDLVLNDLIGARLGEILLFKRDLSAFANVLLNLFKGELINVSK